MVASLLHFRFTLLSTCFCSGLSSEFVVINFLYGDVYFLRYLIFQAIGRVCQLASLASYYVLYAIPSFITSVL
jgi:hypothetical protein